MSRTRLAALGRLAIASAGPPGGDPQLLRAFLTSRSEEAFAELVRRHGPMVFATCRRVLGHAEDAEDACQAAFVVLARKAGSVRGANLAGWLYGVAVRTARGVRIMRDRRRKHERAVANGTHPADQPEAAGPDPGRSPEDQEIAAIVDEELARLPECYRLPVVLCELQGRSRKDAAAELGIPEGTLSSRLAAARRKLADRLTRRGVTPSAAAVSAVFSPHTSARVPGELARAAVGAAPLSAAAATAADGVVKALFVARLKGLVVAVGLTVGLVGGGSLAITMAGGPADAAAADPPPTRPSAGPTTPLVRQLGDPDFTTREAASKALRALGPKARPALEAGARDPNPEVARRAREVLAALRADAQADLARRFDPAGIADYDHPVWQRFKTVAGDTPASRALFARIIADPARLHTLDAAAADPGASPGLYRAAVAAVGRQYEEQMPQPTAPPVTSADRTEIAAYLILLGTSQASGAGPRPAEFDSGESALCWGRGLRFGLEGKTLGEQRDGEKFPPAVPDVPGTDRVFARLFAAWLIHRDPHAILPSGFDLAGTHGVQELLPFARAVAADPKRPVLARVYSLPLIAQFGTPADLPLFEAFFDDPFVLATMKHIPPGREPIFYTAQNRDLALGFAVLLLGRDPFLLGFPGAKDQFVVRNGRPVVSRFKAGNFLFADEPSREAAHKTARAWLDARPKGAPGSDKAPTKGAKVWPHFAKVVGDDPAARDLFDQIVGEPKNLDLLEKAAAGDTDLLKLYLARRAELNRASLARRPGRPGAPPVAPVPLADAAGWLLLGTYPLSKGEGRHGPTADFLWTELQRNEQLLDDAFGKESPVARPMHKLALAWLANHEDEFSAVQVGMGLALRYDFPDAAAAARRVLAADPRQEEGAYQRALAMLVLGKFGAAPDLPFLRPYFDTTTRIFAIEDPQEKSQPQKGPLATTEVRDVAVAMSVQFVGGRGGVFRNFGFLAAGTPGGDPFKISQITFKSEKDREAALKRARQWLDEQSANR